MVSKDQCLNSSFLVQFDLISNRSESEALTLLKKGVVPTIVEAATSNINQGYGIFNPGNRIYQKKQLLK